MFLILHGCIVLTDDEEDDGKELTRQKSAPVKKVRRVKVKSGN